MVTVMNDNYKVSHVLVHLGWDGLTLIWVFHHLAQPLLPNSHQLRQNWADITTLQIQVNPTQPTSRWDTL